MVARWWCALGLGVALGIIGGAAPRVAAQQAGAIRGSVVDADTEAPLGNVTVTMLAALQTVRSTAEGLFAFPQVPPGTYTLSFSKEGYMGKSITGVVVKPGELAETRAALGAEVVDMEEFLVRGLEFGGGTELGLLTLRQESTVLSDAISADMISKAGAATAAAALRLVVGTSVVDGKYVVVRGLADRYTPTLLNDVRVPTADADRRAVQVDQFPSPSIESITVAKTFTPDQQGDSTGGSVNIKTKSVPDQPLLTISGAVEYNTQSTGDPDFLSYPGGGVSAFAIDDGGRALPAGVTKESVPLYSGPATDPLVAYQRMPNAQVLDLQTRAFTPVIGTSTKEVGPNYSGNITMANKWDVGAGGKIGLMGSFSYRQKYYLYEDALRQTVSCDGGGDPLAVDDQYEDTRGVDEVLWGALGILGWQIGSEHEISLTLAYNQTATDEARLLVDSELPENVTIIESLRYNERAVSSLQLRGDHEFTSFHDWQLDWLAAHSTSSQAEPDARFFKIVADTTSGLQSMSGSGFELPLRIFRNIEETSDEVGFNLKAPFEQWDERPAYVKFGPFFDFTKRDFDQDSFRYEFASGANANHAVFFGPGLWSDVFLEPHRIGLDRSGPPAPNQLLWYVQPTDVDVDYHGDQTIQAGYGMVELPLTAKLKINGGVRLEVTDLSIDLQSPSGSVTVVRRTEDGTVILETVTDEDAGSSISELDVLPAVGAVWEVMTNLNVRLSFSQTIARPTFRELAPVRTFEFLGDDVFVGNDELVISHIDNYDLRAEWFRRPGDVLAASLFYKEIEDPIERITLSLTFNRYVQALNYPQGKLYGAEFEFRQRLDVVHDLLQDLTIGANASYIVSEVDLPSEEIQKLANIGVTTTSRPLQGQPDYLVNLNLVYNNPRTGTAVGLFYTMTGESLVAGESVSDEFIPSLYELPTDSLDVSLEQRVGKHWKIVFRAKNLTNPEIERAYKVDWDTNAVLKSSYTRGMDFSLGATYTW